MEQPTAFPGDPKTEGCSLIKFFGVLGGRRDWMVWLRLPGRGGTAVGATLACHKQMFATIPCGARISMGAIMELWGPDLCAIARGVGKGRNHCSSGGEQPTANISLGIKIGVQVTVS
jgi:hypothetical protein